MLSAHLHETTLPADLDGVRSLVGDLLSEYLEGRVNAADKVDEDFAADLAVRLASFTLDGGKRLRSVLAWWGWLAGGGAVRGAGARAALSACSAIEVLQSFALAHDDVMDAAPMRRGEPSFHAAHTAEHRARRYSGDARRYGEAMAILVGDLAMAWADDLLHESLESLPTRSAAHTVWREMRTEVMAGQFLDLRAQARGERSELSALHADRLKTATYTVERPLHLGAAMADAPARTLAALRGYGADVGVAFQLRDDLLDLYGDPARTGKDPGEDLREGKNTFLLAAGLRLAREQGDTEALRTLCLIGGPSEHVDIEGAARALERVGARSLVQRRCRELAERGLGRLAPLDLDPAVGEGLRSFAQTAAQS
ncbi:polyprenyl synthetase family protein [Nocardiopsis metallicus]|uniref:Geranylgeranyl diphosphate synthase type I n=1 Tax=Nocardiopsis metallicus TaxID=179819 RepID=A0A840WKT9_9ACTN|nr:geranylgeranyl diphosphate synthase type I [Nocardiopsis metallicus]